MVGISQYYLGLYILFQFTLMYGFYGAYSANGHEDGSLYFTVSSFNSSAAGFRFGVLMVEPKLHPAKIRGIREMRGRILSAFFTANLFRESRQATVMEYLCAYADVFTISAVGFYLLGPSYYSFPTFPSLA
jgi:hypothetical protein